MWITSVDNSVDNYTTSWKRKTMADLLYPDAFKSPEVGKALAGLAPGSTNAKAALQLALQGLDHDGDGKPDTYNGKPIHVTGDGHYDLVYDQGIALGLSPSQAQALVAKALVQTYGASGAKTLVSSAGSPTHGASYTGKE